MKTIGIIGGLGPPSTVKYYQWLTEGIQKALGGNNSGQIVLTSLNGERIKRLRISGDVRAEKKLYAAEAKKLEIAGADFILIASNTSHMNADSIESVVSIPLLHLATATAEHITSNGFHKIGLLGTRLTMEQDFYKSKLMERGLEVIIPNPEERSFINSSIYDDLVKNIVKPETNDRYIKIIEGLKSKGVEGVILGCTELTLLDLKKVDIPLFDTVRIHVNAALKFALS